MLRRATTQPFSQHADLADCLSPVLLDVERPLELQVDLVVVVDKLGEGCVVAATKHARGSGFGLD